MTRNLKLLIAGLMAITLFRVQTVLFLPTIEAFGGIAPDAWFGPWLSDFILGLLVLPMVYVFWTRRGATVWGVLVLYNAVGAFDYSQGLITQYFSPMPESMASAVGVYAGIGVFMVAQLIALGLLFRADAVRHFIAETGAHD